MLEEYNNNAMNPDKCRLGLINEIDLILPMYLNGEERISLSNRITKIINDYDVTKRNLELVKYDDYNERLLNIYKGCLTIDGKSKRTIKCYEQTLKHIFDFFGSKHCDTYSVYDIRYFLACEKERGISNSTLENIRANLSAFFQWMAKEDIISKNPLVNISNIKFTKTVKNPLNEIEIDSLRSACKNDKERAIIETLLSSGLRVSELINLKIDDIDFNLLKVYVRNGKGNKDRITYITSIASKYIKAYLCGRKKESEYLFTSIFNGKLTTSGVAYIINEIAKRANVKNVHPHRFRRTFATNLAKNGMEIQCIKQLLGHSNINTTLIYVYTSDNKVKSSYDIYMRN